MEALRLFSKTILTLEDIEKVATHKSYSFYYYGEGCLRELYILFEEGVYMTWGDYIGDDFPDEETLKRRDALGLNLNVICCYHLADLPKAIPFLKGVLTEYGGVVDCTPESTKFHDIDHLEEMMDDLRKLYNLSENMLPLRNTDI